MTGAICGTSGAPTARPAGLTNPEPDYLVTRIDRDAHTFTVSERCRPDAPEYEYHFGAYSVANIYNLLCVVVAAREFVLNPRSKSRAR